MQSIEERLLREMKQGVFSQSERLPRENELAESLGISRTQLRDSLAEMEREGFITRRQGVGTMINRHVLDVKVRADLEAEFMEMVGSSGYKAKERLISAAEREADDRIAERLSIKKGERVLAAARLVTADGRPAIYCEDYIPYSLIRDTSYTDADLAAPIFVFLKRFCAVEPYLDLTELKCAAVGVAAAAALNVAPDERLLYMDEIDYDIDGRPVLYAPQFFVDDTVRHTVMRKKI